MRVVFVNLHLNAASLNTISNLIFKRRAFKKHRFFLDWLLKNEVEVVNFVTINGSKLPSTFLRRCTKHIFLRKLEAQYVHKKNGVEQVRILTDPIMIQPDDVVIYYGSFHASQFDLAAQVRGFKVVDMLQFFGDKERATLLKGCGITHFVYEVDLRKYSKLFQKNYANHAWGFLQKPFTYQPRFCVKKPFAERKNKAVGMGTLTKCSFPEFIECYGSEYYQPRRKMLLDHADEYPNELDSYVSEFSEGDSKTILPKDFAPIRAYKMFYNMLFANRQKRYFSFDIVEKYNEYQMFICPEDVNGSYGVGTIEGMACGCAMIGWNYGAFEEMGMQAGVHYIAYDGTMEHLIEQIRYYQKPEHYDELARIAKTGCEYVRCYFAEDYVAEQYYKMLCETMKSQHKAEKSSVKRKTAISE